MLEVNKKKKFTSVQITAVTFLLLILVGGFLLTLPICNEKPITYIDALFV